MDDLFRWKVLLKALILPPLAPLLIAAIGLLILSRRPRAGRALVIVGLVTLTLLSIPAVSFALLQWVDDSPPMDLARLPDAQAIVILGGGLRRGAPEYGGDTMGRLTLERVRYGAMLARRSGLPVLVSGGKAVPSDSTEAAVMREALKNEFGVAVRWAEDRSRNTHENAAMSAALLRADGVKRVLLVAHGFDMPRAVSEFAAAGIYAIAAPTGLASTRHAYRFADFVPSVDALQWSYYALYEAYADAWRRIAARVGS